MSIALDIAMFMRNSETKLNLSLNARCVANTLAFRIGSNSNSWVSQKCLAEELGISESNVKAHCKSLKKAGLIDINSSRKDKRRNVYNFTKTILNYHAMNDDQKRKCHQKLGDSYKEIEHKTTNNTAYFQAVSTGDTAYFQAVNTAYFQAVSQDKKTSTDLGAEGLSGFENSPKGKVYNKKKSKITKKSVAKTSPRADTEIDVFFEPTEKHKALAQELGVDCENEVKGFVDYYRANGKKMRDWGAAFNNWMRKSVEFTKKYQKTTKEHPINSVMREIQEDFAKQQSFHDLRSSQKLLF